MILGILKDRINRRKFKKEWRRRNPGNETDLAYPVNMDYVSVGKHSYGFINVDTYNEGERLKIGNFCSIGPNVIFILNADHRLDTISTFPFKVKICGERYEATSKGDIVVDDDVWIGYGATILSGVHIGQEAVIAAGAVVAYDVEPYSIVGGIPAKTIKKRFDDEMIEELLKVDYSSLTDDEIRSNIKPLYDGLKDVSQLDWLPRKSEKGNSASDGK